MRLDKVSLAFWTSNHVRVDLAKSLGIPWYFKTDVNTSSEYPTNFPQSPYLILVLWFGFAIFPRSIARDLRVLSRQNTALNEDADFYGISRTLRSDLPPAVKGATCGAPKDGGFLKWRGNARSL